MAAKSEQEPQEDGVELRTDIEGAVGSVQPRQRRTDHSRRGQRLDQVRADLPGVATGRAAAHAIPFHDRDR